MSIEKSTVEELRGFAADLDDRDEVTPNELDMLRCAASMIEKLLDERDEARREVCQLMRPDDYYEPFDGTVFEYAKLRKWDCFKENTND